MMRKILTGISEITARVRRHHLYSFAATSAYFLLLSFIPFILILLVLIRFTSISETDMMNTILSVVPKEFSSFAGLIVKEVYTKSLAVVPISVIIALWSAAKAIHALTYGLNVVNHVEKTKGWFYLRFRSMLYTMLMALTILLALMLMVFGKGFQARLPSTLTITTRMLDFILSNRYVLSVIILSVVFVLMYTFLPNRKMDIYEQIPGALMVGLAWSVFSWVISFLYSETVMRLYGSLTAIIIAMIWMYFAMYFFLVGAELNFILSEDREDNLIVNMIKDATFTRFVSSHKKSSAEEYEMFKSIYGEHKNRKVLK